MLELAVVEPRRFNVHVPPPELYVLAEARERDGVDRPGVDWPGGRPEAKVVQLPHLLAICEGRRREPAWAIDYCRIEAIDATGQMVTGHDCGTSTIIFPLPLDLVEPMLKRLKGSDGDR